MKIASYHWLKVGFILVVGYQKRRSNRREKKKENTGSIIALGIRRDICSDNGDTYCVSDVRVYLAYFSLYHDTILWLEKLSKNGPFVVIAIAYANQSQTPKPLAF